MTPDLVPPVAPGPTPPADLALLLVDQVLPADRHPVAVYLARLAPGSRRTMRQALAVIAAGLAPGATVATLPWWRLRYAHVAAVRAQLATRYAPATANKALAALRGVLHESRRLGLLSADACATATDVASVRGVRLPRGRAVAASELRALFAACDPTTATGARNAALLAVLYAGGLRRAEAAALQRADLDAATWTLRVQGKGNTQRALPLEAPGARAALAAWLAVRGEDPGPLFHAVTKGGRVRPTGLTGQSVLELLRRLARAAGVAAFSPHDLRRTFIGDLLDVGADLATVQQLAGHAQVTTTARYDRRGEHTKRRAAGLLHVPFRHAP